MRRVVRTSKWHSVEVRVRRGHDGRPEIRLAADQRERWRGTWLTPKSARALSALLLRAIKEHDRRLKRLKGGG